MFYLCSIGSNMEPHHHVSSAIGELVTQFGQLSLSSVIQTKPVGMTSPHDFLNCLFVVESPLSSGELKGHFVALEQAHGRDRSDPLCKVKDRPLDIDILASHPLGDFSAARVDSYLEALLAELCGEAVTLTGKTALYPCGQRVGTAPRRLSH
ncbi:MULTISPECIES: 2-amino-4-hydroxy-6-hydroxymethyldihydropteridine diphosphokinase [Aeromonas]|uniref:2-amino-4-hydroxy-6-hydroxymethyldihydropteridine diphosphokinase n=1 Tax=Aeromonas schubertii TaxID=652 RepID=A0A0S2SPD9_9GAMM|nr:MULTISPECIES: 2-amino-4-hydroxy-6-hydroxymethyldihydropteridine diphosphokinase [Aeromonas]ALP43525.1 7, 8-dihydro-6-hydroxymethylpterin-pyrophosphokinase [Aeromonas schubertii]KUE79631.1 7,8-dihydro-6-hydroxymethylpterin-pyrophosphokinase [Aeromonas schubertii]MBZ6065339.1 2-amino-4-hydroxy-6-hydroxymethyldihydropteridine diphosphokinase [Aeromonas schubertii]MBZ6072403.1 2-amino-4-hydroxy-6-hydroxymethyldihydropteridine diphosphokinase [Aeromonas schubertii]TNI67818.1 2-amino-4-hydroxy-6-